jgi:hypothetical protein
VLFRLHVFTGIHVEGEAAAQDDAASVGWHSLDEMRALPVTSSTLEVARRILGC